MFGKSVNGLVSLGVLVVSLVGCGVAPISPALKSSGAGLETAAMAAKTSYKGKVPHRVFNDKFALLFVNPQGFFGQEAMFVAYPDSTKVYVDRGNNKVEQVGFSSLGGWYSDVMIETSDNIKAGVSKYYPVNYEDVTQAANSANKAVKITIIANPNQK